LFSISEKIKESTVNEDLDTENEKLLKIEYDEYSKNKSTSTDKEAENKNDEVPYFITHDKSSSDMKSQQQSSNVLNNQDEDLEVDMDE
jgi:hypothetical protein